MILSPVATLPNSACVISCKQYTDSYINIVQQTAEAVRDTLVARRKMLASSSSYQIAGLRLAVLFKHIQFRLPYAFVFHYAQAFGAW